MAEPMWVYGEEGVEISFSESSLTDTFLADNGGDALILEMDEKERKKFVRKLKWEFLKAAISFFFKKV